MDDWSSKFIKKSSSANSYTSGTRALIHQEHGALVHQEHGALVHQEYGALVHQEHGALVHQEHGALVYQEHGALVPFYNLKNVKNTH